MSLILSGTDGLSDVDGSASTPAIRGTDTNTGIFFPAADTIAFAEGGAEVARIDSNGNLGLGTTSITPRDAGARVLEIYGGTGGRSSIKMTNSTSGVGATDGMFIGYDDALDCNILNTEAGNVRLGTSNTERMRISSSGVVGIGQDASAFGQLAVKFDATTGANNSLGIGVVPAANTSNAVYVRFYNATGNGCGDISRSGTSNAVVYGTTSDYRLKENVAPMTGALAKVAQLKPVTYTWIDSQEQAEGFIAHELQEIIPTAVVGEKDAVDSEGNPKYQNMDTSYLVATLTAAIQELKAELDSVKAELATLKA